MFICLVTERKRWWRRKKDTHRRITQLVVWREDWAFTSKYLRFSIFHTFPKWTPCPAVKWCGDQWRPFHSFTARELHKKKLETPALWPCIMWNIGPLYDSSRVFAIESRIISNSHYKLCSCIWMFVDSSNEQQMAQSVAATMLVLHFNALSQCDELRRASFEICYFQKRFRSLSILSPSVYLFTSNPRNIRRVYRWKYDRICEQHLYAHLGSIYR